LPFETTGCKSFFFVFSEAPSTVMHHKALTKVAMGSRPPEIAISVQRKPATVAFLRHLMRRTGLGCFLMHG
jgi:uncharacterized protein YhbP (UPF0306 family)